MKQFGRLDFAVNNAGVSPLTGNTVDCSVETWRRVIDVNLTGTWLGMKHQLPAILESGGGAIVNLASVAALRALARHVAIRWLESLGTSDTHRRRSPTGLADVGCRAPLIAPIHRT
jgi:NAD(P)-dependent dehydrogenase (short-subunit alcohol dehydrogenase family)